MKIFILVCMFFSLTLLAQITYVALMSISYSCSNDCKFTYTASINDYYNFDPSVNGNAHRTQEGESNTRKVATFSKKYEEITLEDINICDKMIDEKIKDELK